MTDSQVHLIVSAINEGAAAIAFAVLFSAVMRWFE